MLGSGSRGLGHECFGVSGFRFWVQGVETGGGVACFRVSRLKFGVGGSGLRCRLSGRGF
jgi:hypothetical protein